MRKFLAMTVLAGSMAALSGLALADDDFKGTLVKIDGEFYVVKDKNGVEHRAHFDSSTKKEGDIKEGGMVEIHVKDGHTTKIEAKK